MRRRGSIIMAKYVLCPRCELNYMQDGEQYCDVCKAELKIGPQLIFTEDDDEMSEEKLCPICKRNYIAEDEKMCEQCREASKYDNEPDGLDVESDDEWRNYLDDDEKDMPEDDGVISLSQLADEEKSDELFMDDDEEDETEYIDDEPDDFDVEIDEKDFEGDEDDDLDDEEDDDDDDDF